MPQNQTDKVQLIDAGVGWMMKKKIGEEMGRRLEIADNIDKWHDKISAKERRILMTSWTGQAWEELQKYTSFQRKSFERTGCLMTIDQSEDDLIKPQGYENYIF